MSIRLVFLLSTTRGYKVGPLPVISRAITYCTSFVGVVPPVNNLLCHFYIGALELHLQQVTGPTLYSIRSNFFSIFSGRFQGDFRWQKATVNFSHWWMFEWLARLPRGACISYRFGLEMTPVFKDTNTGPSSDFIDASELCKKRKQFFGLDKLQWVYYV